MECIGITYDCLRGQLTELASVGGRGRSSRRTVRPLAIVYVDHALVLMAWCCLREGFRKFRVDRIATAETTGDSFRPRRASLLRACLAEMSK
ncbi:helix-turn-helix transcriptional regulator [Roseateles chitosanitabidus]|uniref:helix-turn-helix transcriptional regulator n=1 Tax=Roseateles chitosanitabidus TaxID=65048 RepID=UPI000A04C17C